MTYFSEINLFKTTFEQQESRDVIRDYSHLVYQNNILQFKVPPGSLFRQYQAGSSYLIVLHYDGFDYESFSFVHLSNRLELISVYTSPNFSPVVFDLPLEEVVCPFSEQFIQIQPGRLQFYLGKQNPWIIEKLEEKQNLRHEVWARLKHKWWFHYEIPRLFKKSCLSIRPDTKAD